MTRGIALDLGTSGFRAQSIDLETGAVLKTAITIRNPIPGANVMDHLHFAITWGQEEAHCLVIRTIFKLMDALGERPESIRRLSVCGNPIQLSLFQGIPIDDLAYAGERKKEKYHIEEQSRKAAVVQACDIAGLEALGECTVLIPPAVKHEVGADALALIVRSGMLEKECTCLATDYGTNAEMALKVGDTIYTGSAAAGPALEGQEISCGSLAKPYVISDIAFEDGAFRAYALDSEMEVRKGDLFNPMDGEVYETGRVDTVGITGTGVIALIKEGMDTEIVVPPRIKTGKRMMLLPKGLFFDEHDLLEAGRAIGAIRAGHVTLCDAAGIAMEDIREAYMSGAAGTYMDARKAHAVGLIPYGVERAYQIGNTSLGLATEILLSEDRLWELEKIASSIRGRHVMFATSPAFKKAYIFELSYWGEGMPFERMRQKLASSGLPDVNIPSDPLDVERTVTKDIPDLGPGGLTVLEQTGTYLTMELEGCTACNACVNACPHDALTLSPSCTVVIRTDLCDGSHCQRCIHACQDELMDWERLKVVELCE